MHGARERLSIDPIGAVDRSDLGGRLVDQRRADGDRVPDVRATAVCGARVRGGVLRCGGGVSNRARWPHLNALGVLVLPTLWVVALTSLAIQSHPLDLYGWAAWPLSIVVFYWFLRFRESLFPRLVTTLHTGAYWLVALLVGVEAYWQVDQAASGVWLIVAPAAAATAAAAILLGGRWLRWPLQAHRRDYIRACAGPTVLLAGIAVTGTALVSAGDPSPLPYLPLLNPLDVLGGGCRDRVPALPAGRGRAQPRFHRPKPRRVGMAARCGGHRARDHGRGPHHPSLARRSLARPLHVGLDSLPNLAVDRLDAHRGRRDGGGCSNRQALDLGGRCVMGGCGDRQGCSSSISQSPARRAGRRRSSVRACCC